MNILKKLKGEMLSCSNSSGTYVACQPLNILKNSQIKSNIQKITKLKERLE
jgi:hypothetical protein